MNVYGQLIRAQLEKRASDHATSLDTGIWYNSVEERVKISKLGALRAFLLNDNKAVFGLSGTAADNIRLHRSGTETLQIVPGGDTTADGTNATTLGRISAKLESYTNAARPTFGNAGRVIFNTDDGVLNLDTGTSWTEIGGGGGGSIPDVVLGETIPAGRAVFLWVKPCFVITTSNNWMDVNQGAGDISFQIPAGTYLYDTDANRAELHAVIAAAFDASAATGTLTVSFDKATRKITLDTTTATTWKWNTGTHGQTGTDTHIGTLLGFSDAADSASVTTLTAANAVDSTLSKEVFMFQTDADYNYKSRAYRGFLETAGSKYDLRPLLFDAEGGVFSGKTKGNKLYTARAYITITTGTNDKLDFNDGSDRNATLAAGTHAHPYDGLLADIKAKMDALSTIDFTPTYNNDTDKFTITGTGAFVLEFGTGTNVATSVATTLGWTAADTASSATQVAPNALGLKGQLLPSTNARVSANSVYAGFAHSATQVFSERAPGSTYISILDYPGNWLASPTDQTVSTDGAIGDVAETITGASVRVYLEDANINPNIYRFAYRALPYNAWTVSATTVSAASSVAQGGQYVDATGANTELRPKIDIHSDGLNAVAAIYTVTGGDFRVYAYYSTNGGTTWTKATGPATDGALYSSGATAAVPQAVTIRGTKCGVLLSGVNNDDTRLLISDNSGSGFAAFSTFSPTGSTHDFSHSAPAHLFIQYFPAETGANQYRFVALGYDPGTTDNAVAHYWKGDGSAPARIVGLFSVTTAQRQRVQAAAIDSQGDGNRIIALGGDPDDTTHVGLAPAYSNEIYNGGTLTITGTNTDFTGGLVVQSDRDNNATDDEAQQTFTMRKRAVLIGVRGYCVATLGSGAGDATPQVYLLKSNDVTTNTWTMVGQLNGNNAGTAPSLFYLSAKNCLVTSWKQLTTTANQQTEGQIWASQVFLDGDTASIAAADQIDGGKAMAGYLGFPLISGNADSSTVWWLKDTGGAAYHFQHNVFA